MGSHSKKIILLGASFTTNNLGVWALASGAATAVFHADADSKVFFLDYNLTPETYQIKNSGRNVHAQLLNIRFSKKIFLPNNIARLLLTALLARAIPFRTLQRRFLSRNTWLCHINNADVVGSIAGGDSFSDIYGLGRLIYVTLPQVIALLLHKPLVLLPQTIGPFNSRVGKMVARSILSRAHRVYARDHQSLAEACQLSGEGDGRTGFCYDMGFVLEPRIERERIPDWLIGIDADIPIVGINVSGLLYIGGYTGNNMFGLKGDYRKLLHSLIEHFLKIRNSQVIFFPHVFGGKENVESDVVACQEIFLGVRAEQRDQLHFVGDGFNHHEIKGLIGRCSFFLGSRMHACIAALSQCVPAVGLAYSRKFRGVFESIGMEELVIDLRYKDEESVIDFVDRAYNDRSELRTRLQSKMPAVHDAVLGLFKQNLTVVQK